MGASAVRSLSLLRVALGCVFLIFAEYKVFGTQFTLHGGFEYWINQFIAGGAYPFMVPVLRGFVLPHAVAIAFLVAYAELAIGISLVSGLLVRPVSICALVYMATLLLSSNYPGAHAPLWQYFGASLDHLIPAFCFAAFALTKKTDHLSALSLLKPDKQSGRAGTLSPESSAVLQK
jgi:thiosulfate dehydrogenase [quinone] large subunit